MAAEMDALLELSHWLGEPSRHLALAAEGNVSHRLADGRMLVKASGCSLATLQPADLLDVPLAPLTALLDDADAGDDTVSAVYADLAADGRRPSVEAVLHAAILSETPATCIAHTHPVAVNQLLCSVSAPMLVEGALFPDQIVMLGRRQLLLPYVDPGLQLARAMRAAIAAFTAEEGTHPRAVYLRNHGLFVLGSSPANARQLTEMAVKVAMVLQGAIAAGGPVFMTPEAVDRIEGRPDEHYRRIRLGS
jgi:rhamnose utilization protein RhaD (predicted bifunctional aldolase and dehydrogenase)